MKCLETRTSADGVKRRRYERDDGTRITTVELPVSVVKSIGAAKVKDALARFHRGEEARRRAALVRFAVAQRKGWKATAVANELGITEARVRQVRKELRAG